MRIEWVVAHISWAPLPIETARDEMRRMTYGERARVWHPQLILPKPHLP